jgi:ABC-2 type transport system permease protein
MRLDILRGLPRLTWLEIKIFLREPLGAIGGIVVPVAAYVVLSRVVPKVNALTSAPDAPAATGFVRSGLPVFVAVIIAINAVLSLVTIISIYREGGILKRLRATPLRPATILTAHVVVKLLLTAVTMLLMIIAGRRYLPPNVDVPYVSFGIAVLLSTWSILAIGFLIASLVPTARFAQPIGAIVLYPMIAISGLFVPLVAFPAWLRGVAYALPLTYGVSLMSGIWNGDGWIAHAWDVVGLAVGFGVCVAIASKVFRWE